MTIENLHIGNKVYNFCSTTKDVPRKFKNQDHERRVMQYQSSAPTQSAAERYYLWNPIIAICADSPAWENDPRQHSNNDGNNNRALSHSARRERDDLSNAGNLLKRSGSSSRVPPYCCSPPAPFCKNKNTPAKKKSSGISNNFFLFFEFRCSFYLRSTNSRVSSCMCFYRSVKSAPAYTPWAAGSLLRAQASDQTDG